MTSSWKTETYITKTLEECNSTTLVLKGTDWHRLRIVQIGNNSGIALFVKSKSIWLFSSPLWSNQTLVEYKQQEEDSATGIYKDAGIHITSPSYEEIDEWDSTGNNLICMNKNYKDSHGNDTFQFQGPSIWSWYYNRFERIYDAFGNNIATIESYYSSTDSVPTWKVSTKDTDYFAQVTTPIARQLQAASLQKASIAFSPGMVRFCAQGITAVNLYNAAGRMVTSVKQQAAPSIKLRLSDAQGVPILPGVFIAELVHEHGKNAFTVPVH